MGILEFLGLRSKAADNGSNEGWHVAFSSTGLSDRNLAAFYDGIVFSCTDAIAKSVQKVEYGLYKRMANGEYQEVKNHPALQVFQTPNDLLTDKDLLYLISTHIDLYGQAFLYPIRNTGGSVPMELRTPVPSNVETHGDVMRLVTKYKWHIGAGKVMEVEPADMVNILRPDPQNPIRGLSTIGKARAEAENEHNAQQLNASFYENGGLPSGVVTTDQPIEKETFKQLKNRLRGQYTGAKNAYKMMFLTHGLKYTSIQPTQRDMEYVAQRRLNRDQILAIFQVPKSIVAVSDSVNRATAEAENEAFAANVTEPRVNMIFGKINRHYLPLFKNTENLVFRYKSVIPADKQYILDEKAQSVGRWRTPNEIRAEEGLPAIEGGDSLERMSFGFPDGGSANGDSGGKGEDSKKDNDPVGKLLNLLNQPDTKHKIEELPKPSDASNKADAKYLAAHNKYLQYKEKRFAQDIDDHYNELARLMGKVELTKDIAEDVDRENMLQRLLPDAETFGQWKNLLFLAVLTNNTQMWKKTTSALEESYGIAAEPMDGAVANIISNRASVSAKSMTDTLLKELRKTIDTAVAGGEVDIRTIQADVIAKVKDIKEWKAEQIARTELAWSYAEAQQRAYARDDIKQLKWVCGLGACEVCQPNCGKIVERGLAFPTGHASEPAHINCRCLVLPA